MGKYNIDTQKEKLSEAEIQQRMNFNKFIQNVPPNSSSGSFKLKGVKGFMLAGVSGMAVIVICFLIIHSGKSAAPFINPPLKEALIPSTAYTIDDSRDTTLVYKTGSTISIPAHAFVDNQGKPQDGKVEIRYREFHDLFEIVLSGIPMNYDSAGMHFQFESAGMFEVEAFKDNKPLALSSTSAVQVNMLSPSLENKFNLYNLDTTKRCWNYVSANTQENKTLVPLYDSSLAKHFEEKLKAMPEPVSPAKAVHPDRCFTIDYNKEEFPELAAYDGVMFEVDPHDQTYTSGLAQRIWEDVSIERKDKAHYAVTFSVDHESNTFTASPVVDSKNYEKAQLDFEKKMDLYKQALLCRQDKEKMKEGVIRTNYETYTKQAKWDDVNSRINDHLKNEKVNYNELAIRTFSINRTGIWNSDCAIRFVDSFQLRYRQVAGFKSKVPCSFFDQHNKPLQPKIVYVLLKNQRLMFTFTAQNNRVDSLLNVSNDDCLLLAITQEGYPACLNAKQFKEAMGKSKDIKFTMQVSARKVETPDELKALFNL